MDETEKEKTKDETENTEVSTDELSILRETLAKRDAELAEHKAGMERHMREMNALIDENTKLKGELQEMHDAFKNNDVSKKEKTTKELSKELMG